MQFRIQSVTHEPDLDEIYNPKAHPLYGACTRVRDLMMISGVKAGSEFLYKLELG